MTSELPDWRRRQKDLYARERKGGPAALGRTAHACFQAGRFQDALEYAAAANEAQVLASLETKAVEEGDAFLLASIERLTKAERSADLWNKLGDRALELGKHAFAATAFTRSANEPMLAKLKGLTESGDPGSP